MSQKCGQGHVGGRDWVQTHLNYEPLASRVRRRAHPLSSCPRVVSGSPALRCPVRAIPPMLSLSLSLGFPGDVADRGRGLMNHQIAQVREERPRGPCPCGSTRGPRWAAQLGCSTVCVILDDGMEHPV